MQALLCKRCSLTGIWLCEFRYLVGFCCSVLEGTDGNAGWVYQMVCETANLKGVGIMIVGDWILNSGRGAVDIGGQSIVSHNSPRAVSSICLYGPGLACTDVCTRTHAHLHQPEHKCTPIKNTFSDLHT